MVYAPSTSSTTTTTMTATAAPLRPSSSSSCPFENGTSNKDALCRRMGALFLRHRVEQLTDDVDRLSSKSGGEKNNDRAARCPIQRRKQQRKMDSCREKATLNAATCTEADVDDDQSQSSSKSGDSKSRRPCRASALNLCQGQSSSKLSECFTFSAAPSTVPSSVHPCHTMRSPFAHVGVAGKRARRIIVADASILIYSLRTVHEYLKAGDCRVVVPCEALSTLDVLKKGEEILNFAARRSTRFLDERFQVPEAEIADTTASLSTDEAKPGFYPQGANDRIDLRSAEQHDRLLASGVDSSILTEAPLHVQRTLSCILHFLTKTTDIATSCSLAIALPPPHLTSDLPGEDEGTDERGSHSRYAVRADGNLIMHWAKKCGLASGERLIVAPTAASWLTATSKSVCRKE